MPHPRRDPSRCLAPVVGGALAFALYAFTLPPGLTWAHHGADGGDLLAAALTQGIPHPPGYPTYQILLRLALALPGAQPARAGAWLSAACAAVAVALLIDLAQRSVPHGQDGHRGVARLAGLLAGVAWAASPGLWSQAVIVEVYALNALACVALLWLGWHWADAVEAREPAAHWLAAAGLVFGLALGNHLTVALILPGLGACFWLKLRARRGQIRAARDLGLAALGLVAGLLVYLYLPLAAAGRPPVNWGDPTSPSRFIWVASGRLYAGLAFGLPPDEFAARLLGWVTWSANQFQPWGLLLVLAGLWRLDRVARDWWLATLLVWLTFTIYAAGYNTTDSLTYLIPASAVMALWLAEALYGALVWVPGRGPARAVLVALALVLLPGASAARGVQEQSLRTDRTAEQFVATALDEAAVNGVIFAAGDERTFALWYAVYGQRRRLDLAIVNTNLYGYEWYRRTLAETHRDLLPSGSEATPIETLITQLAGQRPVYAAEDLSLNLPGLTERPVEVLTQLVGP